MKLHPMITFIFVLLLALTACSSTDNKNEQTTDEQNLNAQVNETRDEENEKEEKTTNKHNQQVITDLGIYVGQADGHTVEIETNEGPKAFQLTERSANEIKKLEPDDKVKFEYHVNEEKQNTLQSIEKMKETSNSPEVGIYSGQQDSNSIEIETDNGPTAFQLSDNAKKQIASLQIGKKVSFTYRTDGPQFIIESIEQMEE